MYHAVFHLSDGPNRAEAELNVDETRSLVINIRVPDDAHERLQLGSFSTDKNMFTGDTASFGYRLQNIGNRGIVPTGKIRIFDRKGEEVDVIEVNNNSVKIEPDATELLGAVWKSGEHFGKYKAMLDVSYGKTGVIQDTVFFWVLPWKRLISMFLTLALICVTASLLIHSYTASGGKKLAHARARVFDRDTTREDDGMVRALWGGIKSTLMDRMRKVRDANPPISAVAQVNPLTEVEPPPPTRTRYSVASSGGVAPVKLEHRKRQTHDPAHVVHLKK